jgi:DNA-binding transcriptional regulator LsrR (DeoR family)
MNLSLIGNADLRVAIQRNLVSFPAQIPAFMKRPGTDIQQRVAQLYFTRGWSIRDICTRYGIGRATAQRFISDWRIRAVASGFIQDIRPDGSPFIAELHLPAAIEHPTAVSA